MLLMLYCGLRPGEVCALQWRHVDFNRKIIRIVQAQKADGTIGLPKSAAGNRIVPIPAALLPMLKKGSPFE